MAFPMSLGLICMLFQRYQYHCCNYYFRTTMFSKLILDKQISFGLAEYKVILKRNFSHALSLVTEEFTLFVAS